MEIKDAWNMAQRCANGDEKVARMCEPRVPDMSMQHYGDDGFDNQKNPRDHAIVAAF
jgi:hypothetical protein